MSAPRRRLVLTELAAGDLKSIQRYSLEQWGAEQMTAYEDAIHHALDTLRDQPYLGRNRDDLLTGLRSLGIASHTIFYRIEGDNLVVQRILHQRLDATRTPLS